MTCGDSLLNLLSLCFKLIFILIFGKLSVNRNLVTLVVRGCQKQGEYLKYYERSNKTV